MIVIKNMELPKDCDSCPFYTYYNDAEDDCRITGEGLHHVNVGERHSKCPLINIDINEMYRPEDAGDFQSGFNFALDEIKEQLI